MKKLFVVIAVLLLLSTIAGAQTKTEAQARMPANRPQDAGASTPVKTDEAQVTVAPVMSPLDQLRVRDLQYAQDKVLLEMKNLEARYKELQAAVRTLDSQIDSVVRATGTDSNKFVFDLDTLKFIPRPAPAVNQPAKPLEVKPR